MRKSFAPLGLRPRGFTLVELLVVITIIGILSGIVIVGLNSARESARDARRIADIRNIQLALAIYFSDHGRYPCLLKDAGVQGTVACQPQFSGTYMATIPDDPQGVPYKYSGLVVGTIPNNCVVTNPIRWYMLGIGLENTSNPALAQDDTFPVDGSGRPVINGQTRVSCDQSNSHFHPESGQDCGTEASVTGDGCYNVGP